MATIDQEDAKRQELSNFLNQLENFSPEKLTREKDLGRDLSFAEGIEYFKRNLRLFRDLSKSNLDTIPFNALHKLVDISQQAVNQFNEIMDFSLQKYPQNPVNSRDTLIHQIRDSYDGYFDIISPIIAYSVRKGTDFEKLEEEATKSVDNIKSIISEQEKTRQGMLIEIESTLDKVKRAAQEVGVAQHAIHFREEAIEHKNSSRKWLIATVIMASITFIFALVSFGSLFHPTFQTINTPQAIQFTVAKLIIFSVLFTMLIWTGKIYRSHQHNYVINKHRQNALSTFETFVKAANDDQTKSAVLLQATQCIFSPQQSGYVAQDGEIMNYPQVLEIIRGATSAQVK